MKAIKILLLFVLAMVAIPVGIVYSVGESLLLHHLRYPQKHLESHIRPLS